RRLARARAAAGQTAGDDARRRAGAARVGLLVGQQRERTRRPVSRVLCRPPKQTRRPFLWTAHCWAVLATHPGPRSASDGAGRRLGRTWGPLFGLAPGGACHAVPVARSAVGSYPTLSPLPPTDRRRFAFCGAIPGVTPGGRYPPPC